MKGFRILKVKVPKNKYIYNVILGDLSEEGMLENASFEELRRPTNEAISTRTNRADEIGASFILGQRVAYDDVFGDEEPKVEKKKRVWVDELRCYILVPESLDIREIEVYKQNVLSRAKKFKRIKNDE